MNTIYLADAPNPAFLQYLASIHFGTWFAFGASVLAGVGIVWRFSRKAYAAMRRITAFLDEWLGDPNPDPALARPGVLGRLKVIEREQRDGAVKMDAIEHELHPNSGGSMFDKLTRGQRELAAQLEGHAATLAAHILEVKETNARDNTDTRSAAADHELPG